MSIIELTSDLLTGVEEMDKEHKVLVDMLNSIAELLKDGKRQEAEKVFVNWLSWFVEEHLNHEEKFMESIGYPELENHKRLHKVFREEVQKLLPYVKSGSYKSFSEALAYCWGWLYSHIAKADKKYGLYAKERGIL